MSTLITADTRSVGAARARERGRLHRSTIERLLALAVHLSPADRELVESVLERGQSFAAIARLAGRRPSRIRRRFDRIVRRLRDPQFGFIVSQLDVWPPLRRRVAELFFLEHHTQQEVARRCGTSRYHVRRQLEAIRVLIEQARILGRLS